MTSDGDLLRRYVEARSEDAFAQLVRRHVDLVYSAALRQVNGDVHLAQDVAQTVFSDLARKATCLLNRQTLTGWLYTSTHFAATKAVRTEQRRHTHEHAADSMRELLFDSNPELDWTILRPALDAVMHELDEPEREAILLRFFENRKLAEIGDRFGVSEDAARKRVDRALDKLREHFAQRGITTTAAALSVVIAANAVQAAPLGLVVSISTGAALAGSALTAATTATATKAIAMTTLQKALITATIAASVGVGLYQAHQASALRIQLAALRQQQARSAEQIAQLKSDNDLFSKRLVQATPSPSLSSERLRELLRLRGQVAMLRRQQRELELAAATQTKSPGLPAQPGPVASPQPGMPAPFQVQLVLDQPGENTVPMTNNAGGADAETLHLQKTPLMDYTSISSATVTTDSSSGAPQIDLEFNDLGKELLAAVTKENINKRLAIVLDGQLFSAPVIRSEISEGKAQITGAYTEQAARTIAAKINQAIRDNTLDH